MHLYRIHYSERKQKYEQIHDCVSGYACQIAKNIDAKQVISVC